MFVQDIAKEIRSGDIGFIIVDDKLNIVQVNCVAESLLERNSGELKGKNLNTINTLSPVAIQVKKHTKNCNFTDLNLEFNLIGYRNDGTFFPINVYFNSTIINGQWFGLIFLKDEEKFSKFVELLVDAHKSYSLGTLMSGFAHDFNNVFTGIISNLDLANSTESCPESVKNYLKIAEHTARRGASVVNKLQLMVGSSSPATAPFDIGELVYESVFLMRHCLGRKIKILDFEKPARMCLVEANQNNVFQVIVNLCLNAKEAMPDGGTIRFDLKNVSFEEAASEQSKKRGSYWCVTVEDTGIGIPEKILNHVFKPFHKIKTGKKGLGLGLFVSRKIIESMGGWIEIESQTGKGTRVNFYLPAMVIDYQDQDKKPCISSINSYFKTFVGLDILVVDDEDYVRRVICNTLSQTGCAITESDSCAQTINLIKSAPSRFKIILLDINLCDGSGISIIPKIREISNSKIILISGECLEYSQLEKVAPDGILNKPFYPVDVLQTISAVIN